MLSIHLLMLLLLLINESSSTLLRNATTTTTTEIVKLGCPRPIPFEMSWVLIEGTRRDHYKVHYEHKERVTIKCVNPHRELGRWHVCNNGSWHPSLSWVSNCTKVICPPIKPVNHGIAQISDESYSYLTRVDFYCEQGFKLVGASTIFCLQGNLWDFSVPECVQIYLKDDPPSQALFSKLTVAISGTILVLVFLFIIIIATCKSRRRRRQQAKWREYAANYKPFHRNVERRVQDHKYELRSIPNEPQITEL